MKLFVLSLFMILFYSGQASAKCCVMMVGGTVIDKHLGGPGSPLVQKHKKICAEVNERWQKTGQTHTACIISPNEFGQKRICEQAKDEESCKKAPAASNGDYGTEYCKWDGRQCGLHWANFESLCSQTSDETVCNRAYGQEKKGCCGVNERVKNDPAAYNYFQSCKNRDKNSCTGDCEWMVEPKTCEEPKKPEEKGCCGVNERVKNDPAAYNYFQSCKNKDKNSCNGDCQWILAPKTCDEPKKPEEKGCCGINEQVKNHPNALQFFQACKNKDKNSCRGDCAWVVAPKTCDEPKKPVGISTPVGRPVTGNVVAANPIKNSAIVACPASCVRQMASQNCPMICEIGCGNTKVSKKIFKGTCEEAIQGIPSNGAVCKVDKCEVKP